jgi:acyl carrier protein
MKEKVKKVITDIFDVSLEDAEVIEYGQHNNWDSMRHFLLILALEDLWKIEINEEDTSRLKSLNEILHYYNSEINL